MGRFSKFEWERKNYPVLRDWVYLDHPSSGLINRSSYNAIQEYIKDRYEIALSYEDYVSNWRFADDLRDDIGKMIGCSGIDITYGYNASQLFNIFSNGLDFHEGDNIVTTEYAYDASRYALLQKENDGVEIRFAKAVERATVPEALFALTDDHTRAIVVSHVEHRYGYRHDLAAIGEFCRTHNIWFAVDATQSCGAMTIDVERMKVDFLYVSCYKWLQSYLGLGFAYVSPALRKTLRLIDIGWTGEKDRFHAGFRSSFSDNANRYECGGLNFAGLRSLKGSIENYFRLGGDDIQAFILYLVEYFHSRIKDGLQGIRILSEFPPENRSSIITLAVPEWLSDEQMAQEGFRVHCAAPGIMRIGFHYCTNRHDIDRLIDCFKSIT